MNDIHKRWFLFGAVTWGAATLSGLVLGWLSKSGGWGFSALAMAVGVAAGLATLTFQWPSLPERLVVSGAAVGIGLVLFGWASYLPAWRAEADIAPEELDDLCIQIAALGLCHERSIMGVFDFNDVPPPIVEEAKQQIAGMPRDDKLAMCDRIVGKRINESQTIGNAHAFSTGVLWVVLAVMVAAGSVVLRDRLTSLWRNRQRRVPM